ncbi:hypothetical protein BJ170DRAFT_315591 [Xylariales sp. AK1849]|nr:hypothetical protein BJ170DRAFT_315591 [Xylariales sp. AK1849]
MNKSSAKLSNLPQLNQFITGHDEVGKAVVHSHQDFDWKPYGDGKMEFSVVYTTSQTPPDLNEDKDIKAHEAIMQKGTLGLVNPGGSVIRCVDFAPGYACDMHRTQSLDYGIILEGSIEMVLDSGERHKMKRGDVAVQRATQHQWVNTSQTEWARMMFVLQDCEALYVGGRVMGEDLGTDSVLPASK